MILIEIRDQNPLQVAFVEYNQAIDNASEGDKIVVGPGRYGDLNGNGIFGETGEEVAQVGFGCFCMINLNKRVRLFSRDGAFTTVLDAGGAPVLVVSVSTDDVVFGRPNHGFFITGSGSRFNGLGMLGAPSGVKVAGNVASANDGAGFGISGNDNLVTGNLAFSNFSAGFGVFGSGNIIRGNVANSNEFNGFVITGTSHILRNNKAIANGSSGFALQGTGHQIERNSILGNKGFGINIDPAGGSATIKKNNIYGNNDMSTVSLFNCGLRNVSGNIIEAANNFWGTDGGPGPEPADEVCDDKGSTTIFVPFATREFKSRCNRLNTAPASSLQIERQPVDHGRGS